MPRRHLLVTIAFTIAASLSGHAQSGVSLSSAASPSAGQPGIQSISVTGSGFPAGTIAPADVTVVVEPASGGASSSTQASAVATVLGTTRRVTFQIPASISVNVPTAYLVSISGRTTTGVAFASTNKASLTVNPQARIVSLTPGSVLPGSTTSIAIATQYTNFVQGATQASFGPGVSVGGGAAGGFGLVTVLSPTSATAQIAVSATAASGFRSVTVKTGVQAAMLANGINVGTSPPANQPPLITSVAITAAIVGQPCTYQVQATDPDGDGLQFALTQAPAGMTVSATGLIAWTPTAAQTGPQSVSLDVTDGRGGKATQSFAVTVAAANRPPVITSSAIGVGTAGSAYAYQVVATDPDGDALSYQLTQAPSGMTVSATGLIAWTPTAAQTGPQSVSLDVMDGRGGKATQAFTVTVAAANRPPVITSSAIGTGAEASPYAYQIVATDPDGDALSYQLTQAPSGMTVSATGLIAWTPTAAQTGPQSVSLDVTDGRGGKATQTFTVTVAAANRPPVITSSAIGVGTAGSAYSYQVVATDPDGDALTYQLTQAPSGMTVSATGLIAWTPTAAQTGPQSVSLDVTDGRGGKATQTFTVTVAAANRPPVITSSAIGVGTAGSAYAYQVVATDPDGDALSYQLTQAPSGMTVSATGLIAWTPTAAQTGPQSVSLDVTDGRGGKATQAFTITVAAANRPPVITSSTIGVGAEASPYAYQIVATDPDGDALSYQLTQAPSGMTVSATGLIAWTPTAAQTGPQSVSLDVTDGRGGKATQAFTVTVAAANRPPVITSSAIGVGAEASPYAYQIVATDPDGDALSYQLTQAPSGMTVSATGLIAWTPAAGQTGPQSVSLDVTDGRGGKATQAFTVTVAAANRPPVITSSAIGVGTAGSPYAYQVVASDPDGDALSYQLTQDAERNDGERDRADYLDAHGRTNRPAECQPRRDRWARRQGDSGVHGNSLGCRFGAEPRADREPGWALYGRNECGGAR